MNGEKADLVLRCTLKIRPQLSHFENVGIKT